MAQATSVRWPRFEAIASSGAIGVTADRGSTVEIRANTFEEPQGLAISVSSGAIGTVVGNTVEGGRAGVSVAGDQAVDANRITGAETNGLVIGNGSPVLTGNHVCDNGTNLRVGDGATPQIDDSNTICPDEPATDEWHQSPRSTSTAVPVATAGTVTYPPESR